MSESQNIEYKESWRDEYLKWICGFANAQGGRIYIGINDKQEIVGVADSKRLMEDIPNKIVNYLGIVADVNLLHSNEDKEFIVDIKLRNIGDQVAYIKEISFDILDYYNIINPQMTHYQLVESSHTYDVVLGKEKQQVFNVSQSIGANEVDRFQVKLASSIAETRMVTIYYLTLSIIYDEDNKVVKSEKYLWAVPSISEYAACYISHTSMEIAKKNYLELKRMNNYDAIKSNHFISILKSYEENKSDFLIKH